MPLAPGTRLGPYEILAPIGAGGMGEVYKARDTRLDRTVALKFSKEAFSERFEREARAVAALNHPNICQLYDVGPDYLVMEFVEGTPVASVDSPRRLLDIGVQIAGGLAAAHAAGIIHRDLKPDNILITRDGRVKILDFGLAKAVAAGETPADATLTMSVTRAGATIGTIAYMSPEQARGSTDLKPQSDQFSFGLVLYELAAGRRAFVRDSAAEVMTGIIREDADPLPASVPAPLRWIVERLLAKDPADRYDSTRDLYRELRQVRDRFSESTAAVKAAGPPAAPSGRSKRYLLFAAGAVILLAVLAWLFRPAVDSPRYRFTPMEVSWDIQPASGGPSPAIWSPDGTAFAYVAGASGGRHVFVRYLNSPTPVILTPTDDDWYMSGWSPDGKRVIARGKNPQGGKTRYALFSVPVFGGDPAFLMSLDSPYTAFPRVSPDGKALVSVGYDQKNTVGVYTASPVGSPLRKYAPAPFETTTSLNGPVALFAPDGRSIILAIDVVGGRQMWSLPYPPGSGAPRRVIKGLNNLGGTPRLSWFPGGRNGVISSTDPEGTHLWLMGLHAGPKRELIAGTPSDSESQPSLSPDGSKLLYVQSSLDFMIVAASLTDVSVKRVISSNVQTGMPAWAPHQQEFVYESARTGLPAIWMRGDGWDRPIVLPDVFPARTTLGFATPTLSPRADRVFYSRFDSEQRSFNWISSLSGGPPIRLTGEKDVVERGGAWSPDGSSIVYWAFPHGVPSLKMVKATGEATPVTLRQPVGNPVPDWSPDGNWISFLGPGDAGWSLISPDGKTVRSYGEHDAIQMTFSADSKLLYGIRARPDRCELFSIDIASREQKLIGNISTDFTPASYSNPGIRLSRSPDGKSILYPALRRSTSLWMLEGFDRPGWLDELREMLP